MPPPVLPTYYYLDHFTEMLSFVRGTYGSILADEHHAFIARFEGTLKRRAVPFDPHDQSARQCL